MQIPLLGVASVAFRRAGSGGLRRLRVRARGWATLDERMMPLCRCEIIVSPRVWVPWAWLSG